MPFRPSISDAKTVLFGIALRALPGDAPIIASVHPCSAAKRKRESSSAVCAPLFRPGGNGARAREQRDVIVNEKHSGGNRLAAELGEKSESARG
jgi:hypothetical protein